MPEKTYDTSIKVVKLWQNKERTRYRYHHHVFLLAHVLREIPEDLWKFATVTIERKGNKSIELKNTFRVTNKKKSYFTIPTEVATEHKLSSEKEDVKVTLTW